MPYKKYIHYTLPHVSHHTSLLIDERGPSSSTLLLTRHSATPRWAASLSASSQ